MPNFDIYGPDQQQHQPRKRSKLASFVLVTRVVALASLLVSIGIMKTTDKTTEGYRIYYDQYNSYEYAFWMMVIASVYNLLQIPLAAYYLFSGRLLINNSPFLRFEFHADKVIMALVGTAVGATFGATSDLNKHVVNNNKLEKSLHEFWDLMYLPASFLIVAFVTSVVASIVSSETTLARDKQ